MPPQSAVFPLELQEPEGGFPQPLNPKGSGKLGLENHAGTDEAAALEIDPFAKDFTHLQDEGEPFPEEKQTIFGVCVCV